MSKENIILLADACYDESDDEQDLSASSKSNDKEMSSEDSYKNDKKESKKERKKDKKDKKKDKEDKKGSNKKGDSQSFESKADHGDPLAMLPSAEELLKTGHATRDVALLSTASAVQQEKKFEDKIQAAIERSVQETRDAAARASLKAENFIADLALKASKEQAEVRKEAEERDALKREKAAIISKRKGLLGPTIDIREELNTKKVKESSYR